MVFGQGSIIFSTKFKEGELSSNVRTEWNRKRMDRVKNKELRQTLSSTKRLKKKQTRREDYRQSFRVQFLVEQ